jgi:hypothetical protein
MSYKTNTKNISILFIFEKNNAHSENPDSSPENESEDFIENQVEDLSIIWKVGRKAINNIYGINLSGCPEIIYQNKI